MRSIVEASTTATRRAAVKQLVGAALLIQSSRTIAYHQGFDLRDLERANGGRLGFCAFDPIARNSVSWRGNERFTYCSTFKVFLAAAILRRVDAGRDRLDARLSVPREAIVAHSPVTERHAGFSLDLATLLQAAVENSDNSAANLLIGRLGGLSVWRNWYGQVGDRLTDVSRMEPELNRQAAGDTRDTTSARQAVQNLRVILGAGYLRPESHALLLSWLMATSLGHDRLGAGLPANVRWAHKSGTGFDGPINDIGLAMSADRRLFMACFYDCPSGMKSKDRAKILAEVGRRAGRAFGLAAAAAGVSAP